MPDDLSDLVDEVRKRLSMPNAMDPIGPDPEEPEPADLPKATVNVPLVTRLWIRWLPLSIAFAGLAFAAWIVVMVVTTTRFNARAERMDARIRRLEETLDAVLRWSECPVGCVATPSSQLFDNR